MILSWRRKFVGSAAALAVITSGATVAGIGASGVVWPGSAGQAAADPQVTQVVLEDANASETAPFVTQTVIEDANAPNTAPFVTEVLIEIATDPNPCESPVAYEAPCAIKVPLFWTALQDENNNVELAAMRALRDPSTYYGGYKPPYILEVGAIKRDACDWLTRMWPAQSATVRYADTNRHWRGLSRSDLASEQLYVYLTSDANRQALGIPRLLFQGPVYDDPISENLTKSLTANDIFGIDYSLFANEKMIPQRVIGTSQFPNCPQASLNLGEPIIGGEVSDESLGTPLGLVRGIPVGNVTLNGNTAYAVLIAGHACYHGGVLNAYQNGALITTWGTDAWAPSKAGWTTYVPSGAYYADIAGRRYTLILVTGTRATDVASGTHPIYANVQGFSTVADGTGSLITDGVILFKYVMLNFILQSYLTGSWLASPTFAFYPGSTDTLCRVDTGSFSTASAVAASYLAGGFVGGFVLGANGQQKSTRQTLADFCLSFNLMMGQNQYQQIFVKMLDRRRSEFIDGAASLTDRRDILSQPRFTIAKKREWLATDVTYQYAENYRQDNTGSWNSFGDQGNAPAGLQYGFISKSITLPMVRAQATADVVARQIADVRNLLPRVATYATSLCGLRSDVLDPVLMTHYGGATASGWLNSALWILSQTVNQKSCTVTFDALDVQGLLT